MSRSNSPNPPGSDPSRNTGDDAGPGGSLATPAASYSLVPDPIVNRLRVQARGFWTVESADTYIALLDQRLKAQRARFGVARLLCDLREATVLGADVAARFGRANGTMFLPTDRAAFIVKSHLILMQMRRMFDPARAQAFLVADEADAWLDSFD